MEGAPALEILAREPEGFSIWNGPPFDNGQPKVKLERVPCTAAKFSEDGSRLLVMDSSSSILVYDCNSYIKIKSFHIPSVSASTVSPCGTYVQTFQKSTSPQEKNVVVWNIETGAAVYQHFQKNMTKTTWPAIQFSSDEYVACRMATNEVQIFDGKDFSKGIILRLRVPGVAAVELSKAPGSYIATFVAESKGAPASVQIFCCNQDAQAQPVARRSFFRCSTVQLHWNHGSTGLLAVALSDVDKTNQSYYGESKLNYLTTDGTHEGLVPLRKEGPVHDVQWSSSGLEFAVVYGFMPSRATIFDKKCIPLLELGTGPYNTIRWNPKGKFICLAGFGNLPGDMAFWDYTEKRLLGNTKAECSVTSEWSPDGLYFMTATTAPRLQIDNGIKIFHYNGSLYFKKMFTKLYQADWKPEAPASFGDIADLVKSVSTIRIDDLKPQANAPQAFPKGATNTPQTSTKVSTNTAQKPTAYRPPHAKNVAAVQAERCIPRESLDEHFLIHADGVNILAVNYGSAGSCQYPRPLKLPTKWSFSSYTVMKNGDQARRTPTFAEELLAVEAGEGEVLKPPEKSFWAKYWMYLLPLGLIAMNAITQAMNVPEEQPAGQSATQAQPPVAQRAPNSAARRR